MTTARAFRYRERVNQPPGGGPPPGNPYGGAPGQPPPGQPPPYGQPPGYGGPPQQGYGQQPFALAPLSPPGSGMRLWLGLGGGLVGVIVAIVVVMVNVGGVGLGSAGEGNSVCARAVRCCTVVAAKNPSAANCKNLGKIGVPDAVCEQTLQSMKESARAMGKTCK